VNPILEAGGTVMDSELSVSTTLSHETLEAFVDPDINLWSSGPRKRRYAIEVCDPVESDAYRIVMTRHYKGQEWFAHVFVSNFVYRAWFDLENPKGTQYDHMKRLKKPFELSPGGYAIYEDARGEHAIFAKGYPRWKRSGKRHAASRTSRRLDS